MFIQTDIFCVCVCACVRVCAHACVRMCARSCVCVLVRAHLYSNVCENMKGRFQNSSPSD